MPSLFLETFGLVALESLRAWVPVCWFRRWWLCSFIPEWLTLDPCDPIISLKRIVSGFFDHSLHIPEIDLQPYTETVWAENLERLMGSAQKVLLVHDYHAKIGGAEEYVHQVQERLQNIGKQVYLSVYAWNLSRSKRIVLFLIAPFAFWRGTHIQWEIRDFQPDIIWIHSIMRYHGYWALRAIARTGLRTMIYHHDLGLIVPRPSNLTSESDIPKNLTFHTFMRWSENPIEFIARIGKYLYLRGLWIYLWKIGLHMVPADFMVEFVEGFWASEVVVFPHYVK